MAAVGHLLVEQHLGLQQDVVLLLQYGGLGGLDCENLTASTIPIGLGGGLDTTSSDHRARRSPPLIQKHLIIFMIQ